MQQHFLLTYLQLKSNPVGTSLKNYPEDYTYYEIKSTITLGLHLLTSKTYYNDQAYLVEPRAQSNSKFGLDD